MELMSALYTRRTVRKYLPTPIERGVIDGLIAAATQAPTGMNAQPWAFGVIAGVEALRALSDKTKAFMLGSLDTLPGLERYQQMFEDPAVNLCYGAPVMIVILGKPSGLTTDYDCAMAAQNLMLAAWDQGLGSCWNGFAGMYMSQPQVKAELGIPADYSVIAPIIVGYADGDIPAVVKNPPEMVFWT